MFNKKTLTKTIKRVLDFKSELEQGVADNNILMLNAIKEKEDLDTLCQKIEEENGIAYNLISQLSGDSK